ncbi:MAG TPA: RNA polymerase sigma factor [Chitinophagaceae bacterium]|nr:RNA polymerase sigma factor [Chitinophagaceae bacterium]
MNDSLNDIDAIIAGCKKGDRLAQELLYRSFYSAMINICVRYTKNDEDALEALNTGFYKVFKNIHGYLPGKGTPYTWIRTIIINTCLNFIRSKEKEIVTHKITDSADAVIPPEVIVRMDEAEILQLVQLLPPATQAVFNLYIIDGFTHKEIAGMLQISEGTSKWHISEARKILQRQLKEYMRQNE